MLALAQLMLAITSPDKEKHLSSAERHFHRAPQSTLTVEVDVDKSLIKLRKR